jgi:O-succinylbenzoic acid--CoA ligase
LDPNLLDWNSPRNELFFNPRWPVNVQDFFRKAVAAWLKENNISHGIFIPTSGTTASDLRDTKIAILKKSAFLNAAEGVGKYFGFSSEDRVAVMLPRFHVGGLSQEARQFVWGQSLFTFAQKWDPRAFVQFVTDHRITHTSLVPTQLYDLVQAGIIAPPSLRSVLIGGGPLGEELQKRAEHLHWSLQVTYGMTETAAMVAVKSAAGFNAFSHAQLALSEDQFLKIKSTSLFEGYLRRQGTTLVFDQGSRRDDWFITQDQAVESAGGYQILGRANDYAKIGGEGVYLGRLQTLLQDCWLLAGISSLGSGVLQFYPSPRLGAEVHLISTLSAAEVSLARDMFNQKVLPFERIRGFHQVQDIPVTELGKFRQLEALREEK